MSRPALSRTERAALRRFVFAVEAMMIDLTPEQVGRIADHVGEHGTGGDGGTREDGAILECLRVVVDAVGQR